MIEFQTKTTLTPEMINEWEGNVLFRDHLVNSMVKQVVNNILAHSKIETMSTYNERLETVYTLKIKIQEDDSNGNLH